MAFVNEELSDSDMTLTDLRMQIDTAACQVLGRTPEQIAVMTLHEFANLLYDKGLDYTFSVSPTLPRGEPGKLKISANGKPKGTPIWDSNS